MALYTVVSGNVALAADLNQVVNLLNGTDTATQLTVSNRIRAQLTGATAASGYVGGTASGAPSSGTFALGDFVIDQTGQVWVCTTAGTPGTWTKVGVSINTAAGNIKDVVSAAAAGSRTDVAATDHQHSWATMINTALTWTALQTFNQRINIPSNNGSSWSGTAYPAVVAFGSQAQQIMTASTRNDTDAVEGDILINV